MNDPWKYFEEVLPGTPREQTLKEHLVSGEPLQERGYQWVVAQHEHKPVGRGFVSLFTLLPLGPVH